MRTSLILVTTALLISFGSASAQQGTPLRVRTLPTGVEEFAEPFSHVGEIVELPDRRVLISDFREDRLLLVDFARGSVRDAARTGSGPREFRGASPMIAAPGGQVWAWDVAQDRILVFDRSGVPVRTRPANVQGAFAMLPRAADSSGSLFGEFRGWRREPNGLVQEESSAVLRQIGARVDTVALVLPIRRPHRTSRDRYRVRSSGFATQDAWGVFRDGRVIVVRGANYQPEIHLPNGSRRAAAPIPFRAIPVTASDRREALAATQRLLDDARQGSRSSDASERMAKLRVTEPEKWAAFKPPLRDAIVRVDSRDRAWVPVYDVDERTGLRFDLLDRDGRRVDAVRIPRGEQLVGFGAGVLFTIRRDADDLSYLRRYPLP